MRNNPFQTLARLGWTLSVLTFLLIVLGAMTRAMDAGMACPDWPLCHGQLIPPMDPQIFAEWFHRLVAALVSFFFLGIIVFVVAVKALRQAVLGWMLLAMGLLAFQILLGALTVWHVIAPATVTTHLGNALLFSTALLIMTLKAGRLAKASDGAEPPVERPLAWGALLAGIAVYAQILLGGAVSSNFAGLACPDWPTCNGLWFPALDGLVGLQMAHRYLAYTVVIALGVLMWRASRSENPRFRWSTRLAFFAALGQAALGVLNVWLMIPVPLSAAHMAIATVIFTLTVVASYQGWAIPYKQEQAVPASV